LENPSLPPSLIFPEAIRLIQEENIIGSVVSSRASSRTYCRYTSYAFIVVLGSFFCLLEAVKDQDLRDRLGYFVSGEYVNQW